MSIPKNQTWAQTLSHPVVCAKSLQSYQTLCYPMNSQPTRLICPGAFPVKNTGVSCCALLQWIFLTQGLNLHLLCLLHWQAGPVPLAPLGKPRYIFTTNLCGNDSQAWFKDEDTEVWKLSDVIKAPQSFEAEQE